MISAYPQNSVPGNYGNAWWGVYPPNQYATFQTSVQQNVSANIPQTEGQFQTIDTVVWVQGENAAKAYTVPPGKTVMLLDSESDRFYIKQADPYGKPLPLKCFHYSADSPSPEPSQDNFVTRREFDELKASLEALRKPVNGETKEGE